MAQPTPIPLPAGSLDAVAALNYTGGTTGLPKGCIHTQGDTGSYTHLRAHEADSHLASRHLLAKNTTTMEFGPVQSLFDHVTVR
ncbi:AMP-binding protein, partial [Acinetobacter baumannii]|uniref:AMP-binding protein n=1 Tax=Acinetobacter baumannii TaxID=470 RepID=UPI001D191974